MCPAISTWSPEQIARLATMRANGFGIEAVALAVGHSVSACKRKAHELGIYKGGMDKAQASQQEKRQAFHRETYSSPASESKKEGKWRPCLCCTKKFWSTGPGHRLCGNCRQISVSPLAMPARVLR